MRRSRFQFTISQLCASTVLAGLAVSLLPTDLGPFVIAVMVVIFGFALDRAKGGQGTLGGALAGIALSGGIGVAAYAYYSLNPEPGAFRYLGPPALTLPLFCLGGLIWGLICSAGLSFAIDVVRYFRPEPSGIDSSSRPTERPRGQSQSS